LISAIGLLEKNQLVIFDRFPYSDLQNVLNLFIELGWAKKYETEKQTYTELLPVCRMIEDNIESIITKLINENIEFKRFLLMHSIFRVQINKDQGKILNIDPIAHDYFERLMIKVLQPDDSDVEWLLSEPEVPIDLLKKFEIFGPEPWKDIRDNIVITYKMWGDYKKGEQSEPIQITDLDWKRIQDETNESILSIKTHPVIEMAKVIEDDDMPF
jgi:hypothetical protein